MATLREGCEPPVQPKIPASASQHPLYPEYLRCRAAWAAQLVTGPSFESWLSMKG